MEQLVARRAHNPKVIGSSPVSAMDKSPRNFEKFLGLFCIINLFDNLYGII